VDVSGSTGTGLGARDQAALDRYQNAIMGTFGVPQRVLARGEGSYVWDADGNRYLDLLGGIAVTALGHAHPGWVKAIADQAATLAQASNFFATEPQITLAERLLQLADAPAGSRVFLTNSGTEAMEAVFKMARKTGRTRIIALEGSFHGRSMGALALTGKAAFRTPFEPLPAGVEFVPRNDLEALRAAAGPDLSAIVLEPILGESGVYNLTTEYLTLARELATEHGALLAFDEVQTGVARTGAWFAHQLHGVVPDVMALAKGLGGGVPIGAVVAFGPWASTLLLKGEHGSTFGGNALATAAALATLRILEDEDVLTNVKNVGEHVRGELLALPFVAEVRGEGLMIGAGLTAPVAPQIAAAALEAGFIVNAPNADSLRLVPALTITAAEADTFVAWLADAAPAIVAAYSEAPNPATASDPNTASDSNTASGGEQ
jgi:acetylornithine/N-succinyldiaminopimelate aminotransferase